MTDALATRSVNGAGMAEPDPLESFPILDVFAGGVADEAPRLDALATISAGERAPGQNGRPGLPRRTTDGRIVLHDPNGRAPGLLKALEQSGFKSLCVAFPFDDPRHFIQQRFTRYSASALEVYGDERELRVIDQGAPRPVKAGSPEYARLVATCKVSVSVYFVLAEWGQDGPAVVLPDGLGFYRLRFTSRNSLRSVVNALRQVGRFTRGHVAGVPFDLRIDYREVSDGAGKRYTVPVWALVMRPPLAFRLTSRNFAEVMQGALAQGSALMLPPPSQETLALAAYEGAVEDLDELAVEAASEAEIAHLADGGTCDAAHWKARWGAVVDGTRFDDPVERRKFIRHFTRNRFASLKDFLVVATEGDAEALIAEVMAEIRADRSEVEAQAAGVAAGELDDDEDAEEADYVEVYDGEVPEDGDDEEADADDEAEAADAERTDAEAAGDQADPLGIDAETAVATLAAKAADFLREGGQDGAATPGQLRGVKGVARELGLSAEDLGVVLVKAFGRPQVEALSNAQARAVMVWAGDAETAKRQARHVVMFYGGQRSLV